MDGAHEEADRGAASRPGEPGASLTDSQRWLVLALVLVAAGMLYLLAPILTPFLLAFVLAYLGDPLVDRLERAGLSRAASASAVVVLLGIVVVVVPLLLLPVLGPQVRALLQALPKLLDWVTLEAIPWLNATLALAIEVPDAEAIRATVMDNLSRIGSVSVDVVRYVSRSGLALAAWLASAVLVPVVTFYMLRDWDRFVAAVHELVPRRIERSVVSLTRESDMVLGAFLRGQLTVMLALSVVYSVGLTLVGLDAAIAIGVLSGLVSFVPYLGVLVGLVTGALAALAESPSVLQLAGVGVVFGVGQMLEGMVLTPLLVGDRVGLHPVAVIFAVLAGAQLFGFLGVLLALPVASVLAVLLREARRRYRESTLYDEAHRGEEPSRVVLPGED